LLGQAG
jgi:hypothetical protein